MQTEEKLTELKDLSIFLAYNTNVDVITHIDDEFKDLFTEEEGKKAKKQEPKLLEDKVDLLTAVFDCMEKGQGNEIQITDKNFRNWLENNLTTERKRLGGQAGIMSNLLSKLGCETILYTTNLSEEQASLFEANDKLKFPHVENNKLKLDHPSECYREIPTKKNWIIEFFEDQELFGVQAEENSRFIASSSYRHENLELGEVEGKVEELAESVDCMILAGYHNLLKEYPDGTTWKDHLNSAKEFLRRIKDVKPEINVQIEFSAIHRKELREAILKEVVPLADILSFDPNELELIQKDMNITKKVPKPEEPYKLSKALEKLVEKLDVSGVSMHTHYYYMSVSRGYIDPEFIKEGFKFARDAAWTKASGRELRPENLAKAEEVEPSEKGKEYRRSLADSVQDQKLAATGVHRDEFDIVMVPNKLYEDPELTVGLGDVVSSTSFAVENALR